jgi:ClpX C4-type zinc finger
MPERDMPSLQLEAAWLSLLDKLLWQQPHSGSLENMSKHQYCSFCGKARHEVFYLVVRPTACICDECIENAVGVVAGRRQAVERGEPVDLLARRQAQGEE